MVVPVLLVACGEVRNSVPDAAIDAPQDDAAVDAPPPMIDAPVTCTAQDVCGTAANVCCDLAPDVTGELCRLSPMPGTVVRRTIDIAGSASPNNHRYRAFVIDTSMVPGGRVCATIQVAVTTPTRPVSVDFVEQQLVCAGPVGGIATAYDMNPPATRSVTLTPSTGKTIKVGVEPSFASGSGSSRVTIDVRAGACP